MTLSLKKNSIATGHEQNPPWLDLWWMDLPAHITADRLRLWASSLPTHEVERAARYRHVDRQAQALASRALLRHALSFRSEGNPVEWQIDVDSAGRPFLPGAAGRTDFNISHTDRMVICGVSSGFAVGVDVEHSTRAPQMVDLTRRFLSPREQKVWRGKSGEEADGYLVQLWTLKEAWAKARGLGLRLDLTEVSFEIDSAGNIRLQADDLWQFSSRFLRSGHCIAAAWHTEETVQLSFRDGADLIGAAR